MSHPLRWHSHAGPSTLPVPSSCLTQSATTALRLDGRPWRLKSGACPLRCQPSNSPQPTAPPSPASTPSTSYNYNAAEGPSQKATIESVFGPLQASGYAPDQGNQENLSAALTYQISERNLVWNDDLKVRLIKRIAANQMGISDEEVDWRLSQLAVLLPGLVPRLLRAPPQLVARVAARPDDVAQRVLELKLAFPSADLVTMMGNRLSLLLDDDMEQVKAAAVRLREMLPGMDVDRFVTDHPLVIDTDTLAAALEDCRRLLPNQEPVQLLRGNPDMVLSLVKGKHLIEYDQVANPWA